MNIGQTIKETRLKKGITQQELSDVTGIRQDVISRIENGPTGRIEVIEKIFEALEIEVR